MSATIKIGWLKDESGNKFAPKTLTSQIVSDDGTLFEDKIEAYIDESLATKADSSHTHDDIYYTEAEIDEIIDEVDIKASTQSDWNQNDEIAIDHIKNRPFYTTDPVETVIVDGTIPASGHMTVSTSIQSLELGERYTVVFDGVTYDNLICETVDGLPAIESSDFLFGIQSGMAMGFANDESVSHTIKVIGYLTSIVSLERKYIAEHIDAFAGEKVEGKSYVINEESVVAPVGAEVFNDYETNIASGEYSHVEGKNSIASGMSSHAEGYETEASGGYSHSEGGNTIASGAESHAEGHWSRATNDASHAEGFGTEASGLYSHAEGDNAFATGQRSHAEGRGTEASGDNSHVEGWCTKASGENQHVQGKFNIEDTENKYSHIVGNGTGTNARSNAHTLDWSGNAWYQGSVEGTVFILSSPNGTRFSITIGDDGILTATEVTE